MFEKLSWLFSGVYGVFLYYNSIPSPFLCMCVSEKKKKSGNWNFF